MGADAWSYWLPYRENIEGALADLREQVFRSGSFRGVELRPKTVEQAVSNMESDGTASILDISRVCEQRDHCAIAPLSEEELIRWFGSITPTRSQVSANMGFMEQIERGQAVYIVTYTNGMPTEILFAGYSFD